MRIKHKVNVSQMLATLAVRVSCYYVMCRSPSIPTRSLFDILDLLVEQLAGLFEPLALV
jgi:hypothetical protein